MSEITPENVQEKLDLFQQIQQQIQSLSQQISQIDIGETERTLEEIKDLGKKNYSIPSNWFCYEENR